VLSSGDTRGDAWWRKVERLTHIAQQVLKAAVRKLKIIINHLNWCVCVRQYQVAAPTDVAVRAYALIAGQMSAVVNVKFL